MINGNEFTATDLLVGWNVTLDLNDDFTFYGDGYVENPDGILFKFAPASYEVLRKACNYIG